MSTSSDRNIINKIVDLLIMPKPKFKSKYKFDKRDKIIKISTSSGDHIAIKLTNAIDPLPGNPVVLVVHGDGETIDDYFYYQGYFVKHGVSYCIIDHRGCGYAEGEYQTSGIRETDDCLTVIDYLKKNGYSKISFFGRSLGGISGIYVASRVPDLVCIALDSPVIDLTEYVYYFMSYPKFYNVPIEKVKELFPLACEKVKEKTGIDFLNIQQPSEAAKKITQPIFVIHGKNDIHVPLSNSEKLIELVQSKDKKLIIFKGTHCSPRFIAFLDPFLFILQKNGVEIKEFNDDDGDDIEDLPDLTSDEGSYSD